MKVMHETERERYEAETGRPYNVEHPDSNAWRIVTPDAIAYTTVISAFASADGKGYAQKAEEVLFEMIDTTIKNKYFTIQPSIYRLSAVIRYSKNSKVRIYKFTKYVLKKEFLMPAKSVL